MENDLIEVRVLSAFISSSVIPGRQQGGYRIMFKVSHWPNTGLVITLGATWIKVESLVVEHAHTANCSFTDISIPL